MKLHTALDNHTCNRRPRWTNSLLCIAAAYSLALSGCGGGGSSSSAAPGSGGTPSSGSTLSVTGTAATGLALANISISVKCATGSQSGTTTSTGTFTLTLSNSTAPCAVEADTGSSAIVTPNGTIPAHTKYHSYVRADEFVGGSATVNVTPLTEELLRLVLVASNVTPSAFFAADTVADIPAADLSSADSQVITSLSGLGVTTSGITDIRTQQFTAATSAGAANDPIDKALDLVVTNGAFEVPPPSPTYVVTVKVSDYKNSGGTISGTVSCTSNGATCNSASLNSGTVVTLTATPTTGYGVSWGGACASAANTNGCQITLDSDKIVTASFDPQGSDTWWVSKTGSDTNDGRSPISAFATFHKALTTMSGGDTLYIDDGVYNESIGGHGGAYSVWDTTPCQGGTTGAPPCLISSSGGPNEGINGVDSAHRTRILGYRRHKVKVDATTAPTNAKIGLEIFKGQHVEVGNIVFMHTPDMGPVHIEQSNDIYLHQIGAAYPDPVDANDNNRAQFFVGDSKSVVIEGSWTWGYGGRYGIVFHGGTNNVARRNVIRYDGAPDGNPKAGISLYSENNTIAENNIVIDFNGDTDDTGDVHAPLFTTSSVALSSPSLVTGLASVSWYGNVVVNTTGQTNGNFYFDSLTSVGGTLTAENNVIGGVGSNGGTTVAGLWVSNDSGVHHSIVLKHNTVYNSNGAGVRIDAPPAWTSVVFNDNLVSKAAGKCFDDKSNLGLRITATDNQVFGCTTLAVPGDAGLVTTDPSLSFLLSIDAGAGKGTASDSGDRGATVIKRYQNGVLSATDLWPFPNEDIILSDLCSGTDNGTSINTRGHNKTGWCASDKSLTHYVWEQLGNTSPF